MPPLADAMSLIDYDPFDLHATNMFDPERVALPFGRQKENVEFSAHRTFEDFALGCFVLIAVDERSTEVHRGSPFDLLLHQRLQRLENKHQTAGPRAGRESLVAE